MSESVSIKPVYSEDFFISANESNPEGELAVNVLVNAIIEIATRHANSLGIGNPHMESFHAGWVLSRLTLEMYHYPKVNTTYRVSTWVEGWNRHYSTRCFEILNMEGEVLGYARTIWMVINTLTHENFGLEHLSLPNGAIVSKECPIPRQERHVDILLPDERIPEKSKALTANRPVTSYTFKYNDIDFYRHVNTLRYITLLLNAYTLEEFDHSFVSRLELSFLHEGSFGDTVEIRRHDFGRENDGETSAFSLYSNKKEMPVLFARMRLADRR